MTQDEGGTPAIRDAEYVEVERMDGDNGDQTMPNGQSYSFFHISSGGDMRRPPIVSTWIFLLAAWFFLGSRIPFTVFIGVPLNLVAVMLAIIGISRGGLFSGLLALTLGTVGSIFVYLVGLFRFLSQI